MQEHFINNEHKLIEELIGNGYLKSENTIKAFKKIHRFDFLRAQDRADSSQNYPLSIGHKQTISQPLTVAFMLELLGPQLGDKILDIGSGSGWTVALLSEIVGPKGKVHGMEIVEPLAEFAIANIGKYSFIEKGIAKVVYGDGKQGLPEFAPFDKILVSAAAPELPQALIRQLNPGGRIVIPIGGEHEVQDMVVIDKAKDGKILERRIPGFVFVPLI